MVIVTGILLRTKAWELLMPSKHNFVKLDRAQSEIHISKLNTATSRIYLYPSYFAYKCTICSFWFLCQNGIVLDLNSITIDCDEELMKDALE